MSRGCDEARDAALARNDAARDLGERKGGSGARDDDVAVADELRAAAEAEAIHGGDERLCERLAARDAREAARAGAGCNGGRRPARCGVQPAAGGERG